MWLKDKLVIDWSTLLPNGVEDCDAVAMCVDTTSGHVLAWVERATPEECEELISFYEQGYEEECQYLRAKEQEYWDIFVGQ